MKPPRGLLAGDRVARRLLAGDRVARREWDRITAALEARGLRVRDTELLALYCSALSFVRLSQRWARTNRRRGNVRAARFFERTARQGLDGLAGRRDELARTAAERRIFLGLSADVWKADSA